MTTHSPNRALAQATALEIPQTMPATRPSQNNGFALVIALSLMAFVLLLLLSITTLVQVETRSAEQTKTGNQARQNALLGLHEALGVLQTTAGPDQRVTATNLQNTPSAGTQHLVGVWSSEDSDGDGSPDGTFLRWLISNDDENAASANEKTTSPQFVHSVLPIETNFTVSAGQTADYALLVGSGSAAVDPNALTIAQGIVAQKKPITGANNQTDGKYAWWVGDEGLKATVNLTNPYEIDTATDAYFSDATKTRLSTLSAQRIGLEVISGFEQINPQDSDLATLANDSQFNLLNNAPSQIKERFHDVTLWSKGLLTDTKNGGLKRDLSVLFESSDSDFQNTDEGGGDSFPTLANAFSGATVAPIFYLEKPSTKTTLFGDKNIYGPAWHLLRDYYRLYQGISSPNTSPTLNAQQQAPNTKTEHGKSAAKVGALQASVDGCALSATDILNNTHNGNMARYPRLTQATYAPYISRIMMLFKVEIRDDPNSPDPDTPDRAVEYITVPIVALHNPYNITIHLTKAEVPWRLFEGSGEIQRERGTKKTLTDVLESNLGNIFSPKSGFTLNLEDTIFPPGQTILYYPTGNSYSTWTSSTIEMAPINVNTQLEDVGIELGLISAFQGTPLSGSTIAPHIELSRFCHFGLVIDDELQQSCFIRWPNRSQIDGEDSALNSDIFGTGNINDATLSPEYTIADLDDGQPHIFMKMDVFTKPAYFASLHKGHTPQSTPDPTAAYPSFLLGSPVAPSSSRLASGGGFHMTGPTYHTLLYYTDAGNTTDVSTAGPAYQGNGNGLAGNYNDGSGTLYYAPLEIPTHPLQSIGGLRHANLALHDGMPSLAIGNSFQAPQIANQDAMVDGDQVIENTDKPNVVAAIDFSYALNEALLDSYFFSSIAPDVDANDTDAVITRILNGDTALANSRMSVTDPIDTGIPKTELEDYQTTAAHLQVDGMFNINSTSVEAWTAFLSSMRELAAVRYFDSASNSVTEETGLDNATSILRTSLPINAGLDQNSSDWKDNDSWNHFIKLSDLQIRALATAITTEIKRRATERGGANGPRPSLSIAEFINRDLSTTISGQTGILQTSIENAGLNDKIKTGILFNPYSDGDAFYDRPKHVDDFQNKHIEIDIAAGAPTYLTQGDLFQALAPGMSARSDTFKIRAYGEQLDPVTGAVNSKAWCEAIVQRTTAPITPAGTTGLSKWTPATPNELSRVFTIIAFRWLNKDDV